MIRVQLKIMRGKDTLFTGELKSRDLKDVPFNENDDRIDDIFNIERYINEQGAYRCHVEIVEEK
jgi:hypothetical protein